VISNSTSAYLNLLRVGSAVAVVLFHLRDKIFVSERVADYLPSNGKAYVTVFFVLSGFVVSMMAERRNGLDFAIDRAVRIYIVALPVILICTAISLAEPNIAPQQPLISSALSALFLNQSWSLDFTPFADGPYWSLSYEVFYYLIFAAAFYFSGMVRVILVILASALAGPKILILLPCWLAGVMALKIKCGLPRNIAIATAIAVPVVLASALHFGLRDWANKLSEVSFQGSQSEGFVREWIVAAAVAIHLWTVKTLYLPIPNFIQAVASAGANMSFSLYLMHLPILYVLFHLIPNKQIFIFFAVPSVFIGCFVFSLLTERNTKYVRSLLLIELLNPVVGLKRRRIEISRE
jgi:peptidoglycan/LPS O-acetylase OafA/YrhL